MSPLLRQVDGDRSEWSRWDCPGHRTFYAASSETAAFSEVISYIEPGLPAIPMGDLFDDLDGSDADTLDLQIANELPRHGAMPMGSISKGWREARSIYTIRLPLSGWFVDVAGAESISAIDSALRKPLSALDVDVLTLGELTGSLDKAITTTISEWIRGIVLDDGTLPHGIAYRSKWGGGLARLGDLAAPN